MRKVFLIVLMLNFLVFKVPTYASASANAAEIRINQVDINTNPPRTYFNITDKDGKNIADVKKEQLRVTLGEKEIPVKNLDLFKNSKSGTAYIFLIDTSKSISRDKFKKALRLLDKITSGMGKNDQAAVMTFGNKVRTLQEFTLNKKIFLKALSSVKPVDNNTQLYLGIEKAIEMSKVDFKGVPRRHAVIVVSDGEEDHSGGITIQETLNKIDEYRVPIFTVSFSKSASSDKKISFSKVMGSFARASGGKNYDLGELNSDIIYNSIKENLSDCYEASMDFKDISFDSREYYINIEVTSQNVKVNDGMNIRLIPSTLSNVPYSKDKPVTTGTSVIVQSGASTSSVEPCNGPIIIGDEKSGNDRKGLAWYVYALIILGVLVICGVILLIFIRKRSRTKAIGVHNTDIPTTTGGAAVTGNKTNAKYREYNADMTNPRDKDKKGVQVKLTEITSSGTGQIHSIRVSGNIVIGRDPKLADKAFENDEHLSGKHCRLYLENGNIYINDLNSTNGTYINGIPITTPYLLSNDDILLIGGMEYRISIL